MAPTNLISRGSAWRLAVVLAAVPFLRIGTLIVTPGARWSAVLLDLGALVAVQLVEELLQLVMTHDLPNEGTGWVS